MLKTITLEATIENLTQASAFVEEELIAAGCPPRTISRINIAVDELFSNIAYYAYAPGTGTATVQVQMNDDPPAAVISFSDSGKPYNPLMQEAPDTTAPLGKRKAGGLGIYMVRKSMDDVTYERRGECNVVTITKKF